MVTKTFLKSLHLLHSLKFSQNGFLASKKGVCCNYARFTLLVLNCAYWQKKVRGNAFISLLLVLFLPPSKVLTNSKLLDISTTKAIMKTENFSFFRVMPAIQNAIWAKKQWGFNVKSKYEIQHINFKNELYMLIVSKMSNSCFRSQLMVAMFVSIGSFSCCIFGKKIFAPNWQQ